MHEPGLKAALLLGPVDLFYELWYLSRRSISQEKRLARDTIGGFMME